MAIELKERPIFVIGYERSGTTLLMAMLGCHPRLSMPEVGWLFPRIYPWRHTYGDLSVEANLRTLAGEMLFGLNQPLWGMSLNPATAVDEILALAPERSFAGIYTAMHLRYAKEFGNKPRWGQKTPNNLYFVPQILDNFPNAQFIFITRDGRDACATSIESAFGAGNAYGAAYTWNAANAFVVPFRQRYGGTSTWFDVGYEELVREPIRVLTQVCEFIGEDFAPEMLDFFRTATGVARGKQRDHAPLGHAVSDKYVGIYKNLLSLRDQQIYATVAGETHRNAGYDLDVEPIVISEQDKALWWEWDGRYRAARLDGPDGHLVFESYRDWLVDQRLVRKQKGIWSEKDVTPEFPIGHADEEIIVGFRAWKKWKEHFSIKRQYNKK
ncbi:sulfotransferase [Sulfuritalea sp.]|uniref:sulfotransferase family protein n=1 Tax=Sulfuritalea sp. TaxID=2480090 RepID=UPI00286D9CE1|nr:sulfotransferase [Sulfuritalea sp.]